MLLLLSNPWRIKEENIFIHARREKSQSVRHDEPEGHEVRLALSLSSVGTLWQGTGALKEYSEKRHYSVTKW